MDNAENTIERYVEEAISYFSDLPSEKTREYEKKIAKYAEYSASKERQIALERIIEKHLPSEYAAFFCLCTIYRRNKDFERMNHLIETHHEYKKHLSYNHLVVQYLVHSETFYDYDELLIMAYRDAKMLDDNSGYLQAFCNAFITIVEQCDDVSQKKIIQEWYDTAEECIDKAIELDPDYAKFYSTKARIVGVKGMFSDAESLLNIAISKENSSRPDYAITIQNYQYYKLNLSIRKLDYKYKERISKLENELYQIKIQLTDKIPLSIDKDSVMTNTKEREIHAYCGNDSYAFVSYAHVDSNEVYPIISCLQDDRMNIWFDEGIHAGAEWPEEIGKRLVGCEAVIVMLSSNSIKSANVRREVNMAMSENKKVIVILLDEVTLSPGMKLQFGLYQMLNASKYDRMSLTKMIESAIKGDI
ncbi:MAG: TIR domain-containing protein [Bacteroidales bacterium]|nr:TIR domain-containing protein [Bacteroidales bacterium]